MAAVRVADAGEVPALSAALAEAFVDDAVVNWMLPHRTRRVARRKLMFTLELQAYVLPRDGLMFTADDGRGGALVGACLALPPEQWRWPTTMEGATALRWLLTLGLRMPRATRLERALEDRHPGDPHYYIRWVGVRPRLQGRGLGTALLRSTLDRCDGEGLPAYIEASSERSAALYGRLGFEHLGVLHLPDGGPPVWPMRRPPRG